MGGWGDAIDDAVAQVEAEAEAEADAEAAGVQSESRRSNAK